MKLVSSQHQSGASMVAFKNDKHMHDALIHNLEGMLYCCLYDKDWTMVFVSNGCKELTGYVPEDLLHNQYISYEAVTFAEDRVMVRDTIQNALTEGNRYEVEYRINHADGSVIWVLERGNPIYNDAGVVIALEGYIQNIAKRKGIEQSLLAAELKYRSIFENTLEGIFQTTADGHYLIVNQSLAHMYGYSSPDELIHAFNSIQEQLYVKPGRREEFVQLLKENESVEKFESLVYRKDKSTIWISENARVVNDESGNILYYEGTVENITARKNYEEKLEYQAMHDSLTGLPNRNMLNDRLQLCINFANRYKNKMAVAFLDLDQFKLINDSMGHEVGDQLLVIMAKRLSSAVREIDTVVRLGGDEFVIVLTNIDDTNDIFMSMQRILEAVAVPLTINNMDYLVTCSIGVSIYPDDGLDANLLLRNADTAMYKAKKAGRNNFQIYTQALNAALTERVTLEYNLRQAIELEEFILHYQPKVDFATGKVCGAEALIRWQPEGQDLISPLKFINIAEETGLIETIGEWVLATACYKAKALQQKTGLHVPIAVNVSPRQFRQSNLANTIKKILAVTQLDPSYLELEITENTLIDDSSKFIETLHSLKKLGVKLAIDDFGTGYSSLAYLKDFPIDRLKIDKVFVSSIEEDPTNKAILKAIVVLGQSLGIEVIAEGVETQYQYDYLKSIGCDQLQGYYYSKPLPEQQFEQFLLTQPNSPTPQ